MKKLVLALIFIFTTFSYSLAGNNDVCYGSYMLYSYCYQQAMQVATPKTINCRAFSYMITKKIFNNLSVDFPVLVFFEKSTLPLIYNTCYLSCLHWKAGKVWNKRDYEFNICGRLGL